jgi:hypothetical protein
MDTPRAGDGNVRQNSLEPGLRTVQYCTALGPADLGVDRILFLISGDTAVTIESNRYADDRHGPGND